METIVFEHFIGIGVLEGIAGERPNFFARPADRLTGRALEWFAGGGAPFITWVCLHKGILVLEQQKRLIWFSNRRVTRTC